MYNKKTHTHTHTHIRYHQRKMYELDVGLPNGGTAPVSENSILGKPKIQAVSKIVDTFTCTQQQQKHSDMTL
jgi:calcineurin-like phosphoesterase family protein